MKYTLFFLLLSCFTFSRAESAATVSPECEHLKNPLGLDVAAPRFSWRMNNTKDGAAQTAYRIMVASDEQSLIEGKADVWDSGKIASDVMLVVYQGKPLKSFGKYYWRVIQWDESGKELTPSAIATFEMAMMEKSDWQGSWISDDKPVDYKPAPYFRKEMSFDKAVHSARAYVAVAGLYELYVNGEKIGDRLLDPMYTRFDRRNLYASFDITDQVQKGKNAVGILLGNGWYNHQSIAVWDFHKAVWRNRPRACVNIRVTYNDGSMDTFFTDSSWKTTDSPVVFNSIYTAEHYDFRKELPGWDKAGYNDAGWNNAVVVDAPSQKLVSQQLEPVRVTDELKASTFVKKSDTCYVYTFPRNIAGITRLTVKGPEGAVVKVIHGEKMDDKGFVTLWNVARHYRPKDDSDPMQTDIVTLSGKGTESFSPKFNYKGFQFVQVETSVPMELNEGSVVALEMHSDLPVAGSIKASDTLVNQLWAACNSSFLANLFGYPTDCPQREKNGWTGDAQIAVDTGLYNFDGITVYEKWLADHQDEQRKDGNLPPIIPTHGWGWDWDIGPDWTSSMVVIPWEIYQFYGDSHLLDAMYDNMKRYVDYMESRSPNGLTDMGLGDWVPVSTKPERELTSSIYVYVDADILAKTAKLFGKKEDAEKYAALAVKIKDAINAKYLNRETGIYGLGRQTEQAMPLYWGIVPENLKAKVAANLYKKVAEADFHLDVGLLGSKALLCALSENGYADAAYRVATQKTHPSWGWWIANGATTFYESWNVKDPYEASLNHIMFGEIGAWMYKGLGGIYTDENKPGFKHILFKPNFVEGLNQFEAKHRSPYGEIVSKWKRDGKNLVYEVTVPANSTATLYLPKTKTSLYSIEPAKFSKQTVKKDDLVVFELTAGSYRCVIKE